MTHTYMTEQEIRAAEQRCQQATPGEWSVPHLCRKDVECNCGYVLSEGYAGSIATIDVDNGKRVGDGGNDSPPLEEAKANGLFIAHARTDLPRALADLRELRRVVRELAEKLESCVWRERKDFPNDPYCVICGAGRVWADKHGHQANCAMALAQQVEGGK